MLLVFLWSLLVFLVVLFAVAVMVIMCASCDHRCLRSYGLHSLFLFVTLMFLILVLAVLFVVCYVVYFRSCH